MSKIFTKKHQIILMQIVYAQSFKQFKYFNNKVYKLTLVFVLYNYNFSKEM